MRGRTRSGSADDEDRTERSTSEGNDVDEGNLSLLTNQARGLSLL